MKSFGRFVTLGSTLLIAPSGCGDPVDVLAHDLVRQALAAYLF